MAGLRRHASHEASSISTLLDAPIQAGRMSCADQNSGRKARPHRPALWCSHADVHSHFPPALIQISLLGIPCDVSEYWGDICRTSKARLSSSEQRENGTVVT